MIDFKEKRVEVDRIELWFRVKDEYSDQNIGSPLSIYSEKSGYNDQNLNIPCNMLNWYYYLNNLVQ